MQRLLFRLLPADERAQLQADMLELAADRRQRTGFVRATLWLWFHTVLLAARLRLDRLVRGGLLTGVGLDLRTVVRGLLANPTFTMVAVASLAIGIGANAAIYSVIRTVLLDEMHVPAPQELSLVYWRESGELSVSQMNSSGGTDPATGKSVRSNVSYPMAEAMLAALPEDADGFAYNYMRSMSITSEARPAVTAGGMVADAGYFRVLSPRMVLGRPLGVSDDLEDGPGVAVLSYRFFMRAFGGDATVVGQTIGVNGVPMQVVGVTAPDFIGLSRGGFFPTTEVTVPIRWWGALNPGSLNSGDSFLTSPDQLWVRVMTRARTVDAMAALPGRLAGVIAPFIEAYTTNADGPPVVVLKPGARGLDQVRPATRQLLFVLQGVVVLVLTIACVNLAGLMLARGVARQREMAVRRALGAGRFRLVRTLLIEGLVLSLAGGATGLLLTVWGRSGLTSLLTAGLGSEPLSAQSLPVVVDPALIAATFGVSVVAALLFSVLPALRLTAFDHAASIKHQVVGAQTPKLTLGRALVALQIGVSVPLLVSAVLLLRTVANLGAIDMGFSTADLAFAQVNPKSAGVSGTDEADTWVRMLNQLQSVPGITSATLIENALLSGIMSSNRTEIDGESRSIYANAVGPGFLDVMGIRLLAGRAVDLRDGPGAPLVGMLNETGAREFFGTTNVVGRTIPWRGRTLEIVGIVGDTYYDRPRAEIGPILFDSALQRSGYGGLNVLVKSRLPLSELDPAVREAIADVNRDIPVPPLKTQAGQVEESTIRERVFAKLLTMFGVFALLLVSIGLHGVTSYSVQRRTNEIGVRMALGAKPQQVLWLVQRQVVVLAVVGLVVGVPAALAASPLFSALLYGVAPTDLTVLLLGAGTMLSVALLAGWLPARRAARTDPLAALRTE